VQNKNKKKVSLCFCNGNLAWGGGEKWHLESAVHFAGLGYKVILAANPRGKLWQKAHCFSSLILSPWSIGNLSFLNPFKKAAFAKFLSESGITHLILNLPADLKFGVRAVGAKQGLPIKVYYRRGSALPVRSSLGNRKLFPRLTALIANSEETASLVRQSRLMDSARIKVIYNGLDIADFDSSLAASSLSFGVEAGQSRGEISGEHPFIIGNAGRFSRQKAQHYLLHMSACLKQQGFPHHLIIAGDGELRSELLRLAESLGLEIVLGFKLPGISQGASSVCFTGFLQDLSVFWRSIDLFVLSSIWEGFGYVLAEAMLARKALLAFNCNSMPELVKDGLNGRLLPPPRQGESAQAVGERLARQVMAMARDSSGLQSMGVAGRNFCLENFDQKIAMRKLEELLFADSV
jgi:glycosyltransferase involved in cell wall biosynthesis